MSREVLSRSAYLDRWQSLHGDYDPRGSRWAVGWLTCVHAVAAPVARLGVSPDALTLIGLLITGVAVWLVSLGGRALILASLVVLIAALVDSLDGAVAVLTSRVSVFGAFLDSVVDRGSDVLLLVALYLAGAPARVCVAAGVVMFLLEYARARATALGLEDIGVVTVGERPTRLVVVIMFLLAAGIYPTQAATWATAGAALSCALATVGFVQLVVVVHRRLR